MLVNNSSNNNETITCSNFSNMQLKEMGFLMLEQNND